MATFGQGFSPMGGGGGFAELLAQIKANRA